MDIGVVEYVSPRERDLTSAEARIRDIAYALKKQPPPVGALVEAVRVMASYVRSGDVLVPIPNSKGNTEANLALARALALVTGGQVADVLRRSKVVPSSHQRRRKGERGLRSEEHAIATRAIPEGNIVFIDNVVTTGSTFDGARRILGRGRGLAYARAKDVRVMSAGHSRHLARRRETIDKDWIKSVRRTWKAGVGAVETAPSHILLDTVQNLELWLEALQRDLAFAKGLFVFLEDKPVGGTTLYRWRVKVLGHVERAIDVLYRARSAASHWEDVLTPGTSHYRLGAHHRASFVEAAAKAFGLEPPDFDHVEEFMQEHPMVIEKSLARQQRSHVNQGLKKADSEISRKALGVLTRIVTKSGDIEFAPYEREVSIGKVKLVMKDLVYEGALQERGESRHPMDVEGYVRACIEARRLLELKGLSMLWYGVFVVRCRDCGGTNPHGSEFGVGARYFKASDYVEIYDDPSRGLAKLIAHELGHRFYYKFMSAGDRTLFNRWFGDVPAVSTYGAKTTEEDFAEVFSYYIDNRSLSRDQLDRFKTFVGSVLGSRTRASAKRFSA